MAGPETPTGAPGARSTAPPTRSRTRAAAAVPPPTGRDAWPPVAAWTPRSSPASALTIVCGIDRHRSSPAAFGASTSHPPAGVNIGLTFVQNVALIGAALLLRRAERPPVGERLRPALAPTASIAAQRRPALAVWIGFFVAARSGSLALSLDETQTLPDDARRQRPALNALAVVVLVTVIAPLGEELFFRGFFFGALRNWRGWLAGGDRSPAPSSDSSTSARRRSAISSRWRSSASGCACSTSGPARCIPCIALHALNNSIALGLTCTGRWQIPAMMVGSTLARAGARRAARAALGERARRRPPRAQPAPEPNLTARAAPARGNSIPARVRLASSADGPPAARQRLAPARRARADGGRPRPSPAARRRRPCRPQLTCRSSASAARAPRRWPARACASRGTVGVVRRRTRSSSCASTSPARKRGAKTRDAAPRAQRHGHLPARRHAGALRPARRARRPRRRPRRSAPSPRRAPVDVLPRSVRPQQRPRRDPRAAAPAARGSATSSAARGVFDERTAPRGARVPQGHRHGAHDRRLGRGHAAHRARRRRRSRSATPSTAATSRPTSRARSSR